MGQIDPRHAEQNAPRLPGVASDRPGTSSPRTANASVLGQRVVVEAIAIDIAKTSCPVTKDRTRAWNREQDRARAPTHQVRLPIAVHGRGERVGDQVVIESIGIDITHDPTRWPHSQAETGALMSANPSSSCARKHIDPPWTT